MKFLKNRIVKAFFWNALLGSAIVTRAASGAGYVTPPRTDGQPWQEFRRVAGGSETRPEIPRAILDQLATADTTERLRDLIWLSYVGHAPGKFRDLDLFWVRTLTERRETGLLEEFLAYRSNAMTAEPMGREDYLRSWIWRAVVPGHYDCGSGGGTSPDCP